MKGLLIKDLKLLLGQKMSLFMIFAIGILFVFGNQDISLAVTYTTMVATIWAMGSISYDNLDNGMAFLMTLPIKRKTYVLEKYVYVYLLSGLMGAITGIMSLIFVYTNSELGNSNGVEILVMNLIIAVYTVLFISAIMLPINLKFGSEKARIVLFIIFGAVLGMVYIISEWLPQDAYKMLTTVEWSATQIVSIVGFMAIAAVVISIIISIKVMENKEF